MSRKKTHEEYVNELSIKNPNIEVIGKYVDAKTKILHHCLIHDVYWDVLPSNALQGKGCHECMKDKNRNKFLKNHEDYVLQVKKINPDIKVLETYKGSNIAILHLCTKHDIEWNVMPTNILKGCGCPKCKSEKIISKQLKTHKQYVSELQSINSHIEVIGEYIDTNTKIMHYCKKHDIYWEQSPSNALQGKGCPKCRIEKIKESKVLSHEDYVKSLNLLNPTVEVVEKYINIKTKIMHHCLIHNVYWKTSPSNVLNGSGCIYCKREKFKKINLKTHEQYVKELSVINSKIIVLEKYIDMKTPILHRCLIHNREWLTTPSSTLQGCGCLQCKTDKLRDYHLKTNEEYICQLNEMNPNIVALETYRGAKTPLLHRCLIDGNEWYASPSSTLLGYGCPQCHESKGENQIRAWLNSHNIVYETQKRFKDCVDIKPLPFDFYLPNYNILIEYDGKQHFEPIEYFGGQESFEYTVKHDKIKSEYCKNNGISLLRIPYFKNVEEELNNFLFI